MYICPYNACPCAETPLVHADKLEGNTSKGSLVCARFIYQLRTIHSVFTNTYARVADVA